MTFMRFSTLASVLGGVVFLALPAATFADAAPGTASLASPLAACYSQATFAINKGIATPPRIGPLTFTGPAGTEWSVLVKGADGNTRTFEPITFDANGRAALPRGIPFTNSPPAGPGETFNLSIQDASPSDVPHPETPLGTTKVASLNLEVVRRSGTGAAVSLSRPHPVVVSGAPFANKTMYGFIVQYKFKAGRFMGDPAPRSRKVLRRFKLGKADECGYVAKKKVLAAKVPSGYRTQLYVNAGPKLDKPHALRTQLT